MELTSSAFRRDATIPRRFTCDGDDTSPPLEWSDAPAGTRSFALLCDDPDAPRGTWHHWAAYDIPGDRTGLQEGAGRAGSKADLKHAINDFQRLGYGGPCPPHGHGPHRYHFRLLALSIDRLSLRADPACRDVEREARKYVLEDAVLVGLYRR